MNIKDKWNGLRDKSDPKQQKNKDKEGVKVLHTKSQAGRTQKSGPPATRFECHLLRCTVKLRTACEKGKGKNREEKRQHNYKMLELEAGVVTHWMACTRARSAGKSICCMRQRRQASLHWQKWRFSVGTMLATLSCFLLSKYINWVKGKLNV